MSFLVFFTNFLLAAFCLVSHFREYAILPFFPPYFRHCSPLLLHFHPWICGELWISNHHYPCWTFFEFSSSPLSTSPSLHPLIYRVLFCVPCGRRRPFRDPLDLNRLLISYSHLSLFVPPPPPTLCSLIILSVISFTPFFLTSGWYPPFRFLILSRLAFTV